MHAVLYFIGSPKETSDKPVGLVTWPSMQSGHQPLGSDSTEKNLAKVTHKSESNPSPCLTRSGQSGSTFQLLLSVLLYPIKQIHVFPSYSLSLEIV